MLVNYTLQYQSSCIAYAISSVTNHAVCICLHGYGETKESFSFLVNDTSLTWVCIDLPFHGDTLWHNADTFDSKSLYNIIQQILNKHQLSTNHLRFLGYSMGARVILKLIEDYSSITKQVVLVAPDGINQFWIQYFSTTNLIGKSIFKYTIHHPTWFLLCLKLLLVLRLYPKKLIQFIIDLCNDKQQLTQIYVRWNGFKHFYPNQQHVLHHINQQSIRLTCIYGLYDKLIPAKKIETFSQSNKSSTINAIPLEAGHALLRDKNKQLILKQLS